MTDDDNELLSAYLDGEVSDAEAAVVEADLELLDGVEKLRAVSDEIRTTTPVADPALKRAQLASALELFDRLQETEDGVTAEPLIDLSERRAEREARPAPSRSSGIPSWLGAAAALLLVVGGIGWLAARTGDSDSFDGATAEVPSGESFDQSGEDAASDAAAEPAAVAEAPTSTTAALAETHAVDDAADEGAQSDAERDAEASAPDSAVEEGEAATGGVDAPPGLFPEEEVERARKFVENPPTDQELDELRSTVLFPVEFSICGADVEAPERSVLLGFTPVDFDGISGEAFVFESDDGSRTVVLVDDRCEPRS